MKRSLMIGALSLACAGSHALAEPMTQGGKLLLTGGVSNLEGVGGGGMASWATISGYETVDGVGGNVQALRVTLPAFELTSYGAAAGYRDRLELSYAHQTFDTGSTGAKLGLGAGFRFHQDIIGAKLRLAGDAIYDQGHWMPQLAAGVQFKHNDRAAIINTLGGKDNNGVDYYLAATKLLLDKSLVLDGTIRATKANQAGLLGFGGDARNNYSLKFEGSAGYLVSKRLLIGAEYRAKPDNLTGLREDDWVDVFAAYAINKHLSITAAYADLGQIATFKNQRGLYISLQAGF